MRNIASIFGRHEFAVRRLHSLLGLAPVGGFLVVHLATNASILDGAETFQARVAQIHSLGPLTLLGVEWAFIFLPILFHGVVGMIIVAQGKRNVAEYPYRENIRYTLQRGTGVIAMAFILWHVFHNRGWIASEWWLAHVTRPLGGGTFDPARAAETAAAAIRARSRWRSPMWWEPSPASTTSPTACGPWESPGASGPVPRHSAGPTSPARWWDSPWRRSALPRWSA